jgi:ABC-2 type transport system permease protein
MEHLRLLFWLKWKLMWRTYRRSTSAVVGAVLTLVIFLPMALGLAAGCALAFRALAPPVNEHVLRILLLFIYAFWVLTPLLGYALNDSYDITRLFIYPLTVREIFTGAILGSLVDFPILLLLPTLGAVLFGFSQSLFAFGTTAMVLALFLFHTLAVSQAALLASIGVLRSRRFRDVLIVLMPIFWIVYYVATQTLTRRALHVDWIHFLNSPVWAAINYLPPGLAARAIGTASRGEYLPSLGFLTGLAAFTVGTIYLAGWLVQMAYAGEVVSLRSNARHRERLIRKPQKRASTAGEASAMRRLPPVVEAMLDKEMKYLARDPYFKVVLMNLVYILFVAAFMFLRPGRREAFLNFGPGMAWLASGMLLLAEMQLLFNLFGPEGSAASVLFMFPSSRRQILIGKNLTLFMALSTLNLVFMLVIAAVAGAMSLVAVLLVWMELALVVFVAAGNLVSIRFPSRVAMRGWRTTQQSAGRGCGYGFLYLGIGAIAFALLLPILAALAVPVFWVTSLWLALTIPLAAAYAAGLYALSLHLAAPMLLDREREIVARLAQVE